MIWINCKLSGNKNNIALVQIDNLRFDELKNKFEGKRLKDESEMAFITVVTVLVVLVSWGADAVGTV